MERLIADEAADRRAFDPDALRRFPVQDVRHRYSRRDAALYALSIGLGQDPLDGRQLAFVDPARPDFTAFPAMALVLAYPGFWLGDERTRALTGVDPRYILHMEQEVEWNGPLPVEGDVVGRTRVTALLDKGTDKGSILLSERRVFDFATNREVVVLRQAHYLRGHGGTGNDRAVGAEAMRQPPAGEGERVAEVATRPEQALLYQLNGDRNPLHLDPAVAAQAGFPRPILQGMCTCAVVTHALLRLLLDYRIDSLRYLRFRMLAPVFPGETLRVDAWDDGLFRVGVKERAGLPVGRGELVWGAARGGGGA